MADKSVDSVCNFLRDRKVEESVILKFQSEKMDCMAICSTPDNVLESLGLSSKGDIYALKAFCKQSKEDLDWDSRKRKLLEECTKGSEGRVMKKQTKEKSRKITLGWKHFDEEKERYVNVTAIKGGGPRSIDVPCQASKEYIIEEGKRLFFPDGNSYHGDVADMEFSLVNFKGDVMGDTDKEFTVQKYYEQYKLTKLSLYLASRKTSIDKGKLFRQNYLTKIVHHKADSDEKYQDIEDSDDDSFASDQSTDIIKSLIERRSPTACTSTSSSSTTVKTDNSSSLIGSSKERQIIKEKQESELQKSLAADKKKDKERIEALDIEVKNVERLENIRKARLQRVPPEPRHGVTVIVQHVQHGRLKRLFAEEECAIGIYDWIGSIDIEPEHFELKMTNTAYDGTFATKRVQPSDKIYQCHGCILYMTALDDPIQMDKDDGTVNFKPFGTQDDSSLDATIDIPNCLMQDDLDPTGVDDHDDDSIQNRLNQTSLVQRTGKALLELTDLQAVTINREGIVTKMLEIYEDEHFYTTCFPFFSFEGEVGEDFNGLKREVYTEFWNNTYLKYFEGAATSFIPRSSSDISEELLITLGRIAAHGYVVSGVFPIHICKSFMLATLCGTESVTDEDLISSFLNYHSEKERSILESALATATPSFSQELQEAIMEVLEPYQLRQLPTPASLRNQIVAIAKCEFLQKPSWASQSLKKGLYQCHQIWQESKRNDLDQLYSRLTPTNAGVLALFDVDESAMTAGKSRVWSYWKRFVRNADELALRKILRFVTGSDLVAVDKISVSFHGTTGNIPEIVAHTCSCSLDLPSSGYTSYHDFQVQMSTMLNNPLSLKFNVV